MEEIIWSDLHHSFVIDGQGAIKTVINIDAVLTSIDNIIDTAPGERVMLPKFATPIKGMLFEPLTKELIDSISVNVKKTIEMWDDRLVVEGVDFFSDPDRNYVEMSVHFSIKGYDKMFEYTKRV